MYGSTGLQGVLVSIRDRLSRQVVEASKTLQESRRSYL